MRPLFLAAALLLASPALASDAPTATNPAPAGEAVASYGPALHVSDVANSLRFYRDGLAMTMLHQMGHETMLGVASDRGRPALILLSHVGSQPPEPITPGNGFDRLVMRVKDLPAIVQRLRGLGFKVTDVRDVTMGYRMALATDPDGYRLELVESGVAAAPAPARKD